MRLYVAVVIAIAIGAFALGWALRGSTSTSIETRGPSIETRGPSVDARGPSIETRGPSVDARGPSVDARGPSTAARAPAAPAPTSAPPSSPIPDAPSAPERMVWSVDRDGIQGAVREAVPDIRECYAAWLRDNPELTGKVTVRFVIEARDERGEVTSAALVSSDMAHPLMEGCVLNVMRGLAFDAPPDGRVEVNYPFVLLTDED